MRPHSFRVDGDRGIDIPLLDALQDRIRNITADHLDPVGQPPVVDHLAGGLGDNLVQADDHIRLLHHSLHNVVDHVLRVV